MFVPQGTPTILSGTTATAAYVANASASDNDDCASESGSSVASFAPSENEVMITGDKDDEKRHISTYIAPLHPFRSTMSPGTVISVHIYCSRSILSEA
jgi:hypothetical protein